MDALLASTAPIGGPSRSRPSAASSSGGQHKRKAKQHAPHKTVVKGADGERVDPVVHQIGPNTRLPSSLHTYDELRPPPLKHVKDLKLRSKLAKQALDGQRAVKAREEATLLHEGRAGLMEPSNELEKTFKVSQDEIRQAGGLAAASKGFELELDGGNGGVVGRWGRDGRNLALVTKRGHVSTMNFQSATLGSEIFLNETCRDVTYLHSSSFFAVAQKKHVFIYDQDGTELHKLKDHIEPLRLSFLPYHYLLASVGQPGQLKYTDTSTGSLIASHKTRLGACSVLEVDPQNAIVHLGHQNGTVTLWSPNMSTPHVRLLAHLGPVVSLAIDGSSGSLGNYLSTAGLDGKLKIWDRRNWQKPLKEWTSRREIASTAFSQRGLLAVGSGSTVHVYDDKLTRRGGDDNRGMSPFGPTPYLTTLIRGGGGKINDLAYCPFEDVLGVGHDKGFTTLLVPGAGEPNFDSAEGDMYESSARRKEREVRNVMEKIQPDLITMDPSSLGSLAPATKLTHLPQPTKPVPFSKLPRIDRLKANDAIEDDPADLAPSSDDELAADDDEGRKRARVEKETKKMRGKNKSLKRFLRKKKKNVVDPTTIAIKERLARERDLRTQAKAPKADDGALSRFSR